MRPCAVAGALAILLAGCVFSDDRDNTGPTVTASSVADGARDVDTAQSVSVRFSEALDPASVNAATIELLEDGATRIDLALALDGNVVTATPSAPLALDTPYTLRITAPLRDLAQNVLAGAQTVQFRTRAGSWSSARAIGTSEAAVQAFDAAGNLIAILNARDGAGPRSLFATRFSPASGWSAPVLVENDEAGDAIGTSIEVAPGGNAMLAWQQHDGTRFNLWSSRYSPAAGWDAPALIETDAESAFGVRLARGADASVIAVWTQDDGVRRNGWWRRFTESGGWGASALLEHDDSASNTVEGVAADAHGNAIALWYRNEGALIGLWARRYSAATGWGVAERIGESVADGDLFPAPSLAFDADGNAIVAWAPSDGTRRNARAIRYAAAAALWQSAILLQRDPAIAAVRPAVAADARGNAIAVWTEDDGTSQTVWARRFTPAVGWEAAAQISASGLAFTISPMLAFDRAGNAHAVWRESTSGGGFTRIAGNRYAIGRGWGSAVVIGTPTAGNQLSQSIAVDAQGRAIATWSENRMGWAARFE